MPVRHPSLWEKAAAFAALFLRVLIKSLADAVRPLMSFFMAGFWVGLGFTLAVYFFCSILASAHGAEVIPRQAEKYKSTLIRAARFEFGLEAPVAVLAAQIHQESRWREKAVSPVGAKGLAQFMPATAKWLPEAVPSLAYATKHEKDLADVPQSQLPFNPGWALRALCAYDHWLYKRVSSSASAFDRWCFTLSAYNGGLGWVQRDKALAAKKGYDPTRYSGHVDQVNAGRSAASIKENRGYPRRILLTLMPLYESWGPGVQPVTAATDGALGISGPLGIACDDAGQCPIPKP